MGTTAAEFGQRKICGRYEGSWVGQSEVRRAARDRRGGFARQRRNGFGDYAGGRAAGFIEERRRGGEQLAGAGFESAERQQERNWNESGSVCRAAGSKVGSAGSVGIFGAERGDFARGIGKSERGGRGAAALADGRAAR